ncbi:hypothetical protein [Aeromicrobium sp. 179-A 4D2 NHS]|uniref:hypothetical protein n=1 Tax=Aeromicrobium sp. 179-A 4D2 NHS TaxID=3142375 RepID=UPI0039A04823
MTTYERLSFTMQEPKPLPKVATIEVTEDNIADVIEFVNGRDCWQKVHPHTGGRVAYWVIPGGEAFAVGYVLVFDEHFDALIGIHSDPSVPAEKYQPAYTTEVVWPVKENS